MKNRVAWGLAVALALAVIVGAGLLGTPYVVTLHRDEWSFGREIILIKGITRSFQSSVTWEERLRLGVIAIRWQSRPCRLVRQRRREIRAVPSLLSGASRLVALPAFFFGISSISLPFRSRRAERDLTQKVQDLVDARLLLLLRQP
jgi:hypothetical protein